MGSIPLKLDLDRALKVESFCREKPLNKTVDRKGLRQLTGEGGEFGLTPFLGQYQAWSGILYIW